ncbi:poly(U)-specific endoribonuclease-B-like [Sycon ciliatum]|uniref:poly(U)-specific endoribonuclease-B-like n=1 Tax=Sycon ciliatum TaxID=27933 RepID=UPI0020A9B4A7
MAEPTAAELQDVTKACSRLWELDEQRFVPGQDYEIDLQGGKKIFTRSDAAPANLFKFVKKDKFFSIATFKAFYALLDNYEKETGVAEVVTSEEKRENWHFIDELMKTKPIQYVHSYLATKDKCGRSEHDFKRLLHDTWFKLYRRETRNDSSGFEHVFVGESRDDAVKGFHNWIQFFLEERKGNVDYRGFVLPRRRGRGSADPPDGDDQLISIQFAWEGELKPVTSMFVGVSPEFEIALYTLCFFEGQQSYDCEMGDYDVILKVHKIAHRFLGACYPEVKEH